MKTYLTIWFSSEGTEPRVVVERLLAMGFKPIRGHYDHVYDWGRDAKLEEILRLGNAYMKPSKAAKFYINWKPSS